MIYQNIAQPVPFYTAASRRHWDKDRCRGQIVDAPFLTNGSTFLFVIERDAESEADWGWKYVDEEGTEYPMPASAIQIVTTGGRDFIYNGSVASISPALPCGRYTIELTDGTHTYYSEWFQVTSCQGDMVHFQWRDTCVKAGVPWDLISPDPIALRFWFWLDTEIGPETTITDEEVEDDGQQERVISTRTVTQSAVAEVVPEYLVKCFHAMKHHATVRIQDKHSDLVQTIRVGQVTSAPVASGCRQNLSVQFQVLGEWRGDCCGQSEADCLEPCDIVYGVHDIHALIEGNTYLYTLGRIATYWGTEQEEHIVDEDGFGDFVNCQRIAMTEQPDTPWMRWNGSDWVELVTITSTSVDGGCANLGLTAEILAGHTGLVQFSWDGTSDWTDFEDPYSADELAAGVSIELPLGSAYFRIKLIGSGDCTAGFSTPIGIVCECPGYGPGGSEQNDPDMGCIRFGRTDVPGTSEIISGRYRVNGGAWINVETTLISGQQCIVVCDLVDGDVVEVQFFNSLRPGCPPALEGDTYSA